MFSTYFALILAMFRTGPGGPQTEFTATTSESPARAPGVVPRASPTWLLRARDQGDPQRCVERSSSPRPDGELRHGTSQGIGIMSPYFPMEKGHLCGWPFSYILRLEDMQAAVNKAYIKNIIVSDDKRSTQVYVR